MGSKKVLETVLVLLFVTVVFWSEAESQSSDCNNVIVSLSPCLDYITGNSSSSPSSQCCNQLSNVIKAQAQCLCEVINGNSSSHGVKINQTRAFELPGACNLQTPSISRCNGKFIDFKLVFSYRFLMDLQHILKYVFCLSTCLFIALLIRVYSFYTFVTQKFTNQQMQ